MEKLIYIGVVGYSAIAGPVVLSAVSFKTPVVSNKIQKMATKYRQDRLFSIENSLPLLQKFRPNYDVTIEHISVDELNDDSTFEADVISKALDKLCSAHYLSFLMGEESVTIMLPVIVLNPGELCTSKFKVKHSLQPNVHRTIASWEAKIEYSKKYGAQIRHESLTYGPFGEVPITSLNHRKNIFLHGPKTGFHRRKNLLDAKKWAQKWRYSDPEYYRIRKYRHRKPWWWVKWFGKDRQY